MMTATAWGKVRVKIGCASMPTVMLPKTMFPLHSKVKLVPNEM